MTKFTFKKYLPPFLLFLSAFLFGVSFSAQKSASIIPPFTLVALRSWIASVFLLLILPLTDRLQKNNRKLFSKQKESPLFTKLEIIGGIACGSLLATASILQQSGIGEGTDAGKASFITALYIVIVPLFGLFIKKRPRWNVWASVALACVGFFLLCVDGELHLSVSDLLVLLCALGFAAQIVTIDFFAPRGDGVRISCIQFTVSAVICTILSLIFEPMALQQDFTAYLPQVFFLAIVSSGIGYTLQIVGQNGTPPTAASLILSLESVFGAIGAAILLHEVLRPKELIGCIIVFAAVLLAQIFPQSKNDPPAP